MIDTKQFETFMSSYQDMVYGTAMRLLGNRPEAEDISQTVFLKAYEHFSELRESPTAGGWLKTVATNLSLNHLSRYRFRWRFFSEFAADDEPPEALLESTGTELAGDSCQNADRKTAVEHALAKLPDSQRVPLVLFHFENLSYQEIAIRLGYSLSKVKTEIFRGRQALAKKLKILAPEEPRTKVWRSSVPPPSRPHENRARPLSLSLI